MPAALHPPSSYNRKASSLRPGTLFWRTRLKMEEGLSSGLRAIHPLLQQEGKPERSCPTVAKRHIEAAEQWRAELLNFAVTARTHRKTHIDRWGYWLCSESRGQLQARLPPCPPCLFPAPASAIKFPHADSG